MISLHLALSAGVRLGAVDLVVRWYGGKAPSAAVRSWRRWCFGYIAAGNGGVRFQDGGGCLV